MMFTGLTQLRAYSVNGTEQYVEAASLPGEIQQDEPLRPVPTGSPAAAQDDICSDVAAFMKSEANKRAKNLESSGQEKCFISHCWRDAETQYRKRRIISHLSTPTEDGGPGIAYWADYLDLQAQGPVSWRGEIEEGIAACSKFVIMLDKAWLTSYNCLQELVVAFSYNKPIVIIALDQGGWELLTVPGQVEQAKSEADGHAADDTVSDGTWNDGQFGAALCHYHGEEIVPGKPMSMTLMRDLFSQMAAINLCPCRPIEESINGYEAMLAQAEAYVQKDLTHHKLHAQLHNKASEWNKATKEGRAMNKSFLEREEAAFWQTWLKKALTEGLHPTPNELMHKYVEKSMKFAARRRRLIRGLAVGLLVFLVVGLAVSCYMALLAKAAEKDAEMEALKAKEAQAEAEREALKAQLSSGYSTALATVSVLGREDYAAEWEVKLLREALTRLTSERTAVVDATLLTRGRALLQKPYIFRQQVVHIEGKVKAVAWSPDGSLLAAATVTTTNAIEIRRRDGVVISDIAEQELLGHTGFVFSISWSPDGSQLASGSSDSTIRVWTRDSKGIFNSSATQVLEGHSKYIRSVHWSSSGVLASAATDATVRVWYFDGQGMVNNRATQVLSNHTSPVMAVAWSPDGSVLASGSRDLSIMLWPIGADGRIDESATQTLTGHEDMLLTLAWAPGGHALASGGTDNTVRIWPVGPDGMINGTEVTVQVLEHSSTIRSLSWTSDGSLLASTTDDMAINIWTTHPNGTLSPTPLLLEGHTDGDVSSVDWAPGSRTLASGGDDFTIRLWEAGMVSNAGTAAAEAIRIHSSYVSSVAFSPAGALASASMSGTIQIIPTIGKYSIDTTSSQHLDADCGGVMALAWAPDGAAIAAGCMDSSVQVWSTSQQGTVAESEPKGLHGHSDAVRSVAWAPNSKALASASADGMVLVWALGANSDPQVLEGHINWVLSIDWSPDGSTLATASADHNIIAWSVKSDGVVDTSSPQILQGHTSWVWTVAWAPDGTSLASGSTDGTVRVWKVLPDGMLDALDPKVLSGHSDSVLSVSWSPDSRMIASASADTAVFVWDQQRVIAYTEEETAVQILQGHSGFVRSVVWSPDGSSLASASSDTTVILWRMLSSISMEVALRDLLPMPSWNLTIDEVTLYSLPATLFSFEGTMALDVAGSGPSGVALPDVNLASVPGTICSCSCHVALCRAKGKPDSLYVYAVGKGDVEGSEANLEPEGYGSEKQLLLEFKEQQPGRQLLDWSEEKNMCKWTGVVCDGEGSVTSINYRGADPQPKLVGTLPKSWSGLTALTTLEMSYNDLTGTLPETWSVLYALSRLSLHRNKLTGPMPLSWSTLTGITRMFLFENVLTGPLPPTWSTLRSANELRFESNGVTGQLPPSWAALTALERLSLGDSLTGTLPQEWSSFPSLSELRVSPSNLTGTLPPSWSALTSLGFLALDQNELTGQLPEEWSTMAALSDLTLAENDLSGQLPDAWNSLLPLDNMDLSGNPGLTVVEPPPAASEAESSAPSFGGGRG